MNGEQKHFEWSLFGEFFFLNIWLAQHMPSSKKITDIMPVIWGADIARSLRSLTLQVVTITTGTKS